MRNLTEATLYPGVGLLENAISVGRGTDTPFEIVGAPYVDDVKLAGELNGTRLTGVRFVPVRFRPKASVFKGEECGGVNILLTDRDHCNVVDVGIEIARALCRMYPTQFHVEKMGPLLLHPATLEAITTGKSLPEIHANWAADLEQFQKRRSSFLLY
jgi:uncharacterized protein YbbC (DUF1343 family)